MRVLVVTSRWDLVGGSERYAGEVVHGLAQLGMEVDVVCGRGGDESPPHVHQIAGLDGGRLDRESRRTLRRVARGVDRTLLLSHASADLLGELLALAPLLRFVQDHTLFCPGLNKQHENGELCASALGSECLRRYWLDGGCSGLKVRGMPSLRAPLRALHHRFRELELTRQCRRVLVASKYMRAELLRCGLASRAVEVLPYFTCSASERLMATPLPRATREFLEAEDSPALLCPARLVLPDKGIDYLLSALALTRTRSRLIIAGEGPARAWLAEKARSEGLGARVHFSGWLAPGVIETLYASCSLVVCPSVWNEPFGLVGIEAMSHAKAVVAFDCGGISEWLDDEVTGVLCPRKDTTAMAQAIDDLIGDSERRERMGHAGKARVEERFRPAGHLERLSELLTN